MAPPKIPVLKSATTQPASPSPQTSQLGRGTEEILEALKKHTESIRSDFKEFRQEITSLMLEITEQTDQLVQVTDELREDIDENKIVLENKIEKVDEKITEEAMIRQYEKMEFAIRLRGLKESSNEDLMEVFIEAVIPNMEMQPDELMGNIEKIYRVNSAIAKQRNLPRDIVIYFTKRSTRNDILQAYYQKNFKVADQQVMFLKEIPPKMLKRRKEYAFLTQELRNQQIQYRWEIPQGLIIFHEGKRHKIYTIEKAKMFLKSLGKTPSSPPALEGDKEMEAAGGESGIESLLQDLSVRDGRMTRAEYRRRKAELELKTLGPTPVESIPVGGARPKVLALQKKLKELHDK